MVNDFQQGAPRLFNGERIVVQQMVRTNQISTRTGMNLVPFLTLYTKVDSKWVKDLMIKAETIRKSFIWFEVRDGEKFRDEV